ERFRRGAGRRDPGPPGVGPGRAPGRRARPAAPDGVGHLLAAERSRARREPGRRGRRPRARRAPADRSRPSGGSQQGHRPLLSAECRALPVRDVERRRRGALGARAGEQPLRPDRVRGRRGAGDARLRRRVDLERAGLRPDGAGRDDAPPAAAGGRADHARQVPDELRAPGSGPARDQLSLAGLRPGRASPRHRRDDRGGRRDRGVGGRTRLACSMSPLETLGFALGTSFASGLNLYATVAAAGLFESFGIVHLPEPLQVLSHPMVLGLALTLFVIEFIADKIPYVDSVWDAVHTFIRPPAAAFLSYSAFAGGVPEEWKIGAALLAGTVALTSHGAKATTRAAANVSPEPVSNWTLSFVEDSIAVFLSWLAATHPFLTAGLVVVLVVAAVLLMWRLFRFFRQAMTCFGRRPSGPEPA